MSVLNIKVKDHLKRKAFFDGGVGIQRYENIKYRVFDKLTDQQLGFFWQPQEINLTKDAKDFKDLTNHERHIFTSNLKRQILLDSVQGRGPNLAFLPCVSLPELETWIETWAFVETVHSRSYTYLIRNVYPNPSEIFDKILEIEEIGACADDITKHYDDLVRLVSWHNLLGEGGYSVICKDNPRAKTAVNIDLYDLKKKLWLTIMSVNILEGIRFYVSFACSWAFAELKKMEGNAKIIKFIARDENVHLASTQHLIRLLPKDDKDFIKIAEETKAECIQMFQDAVEQEKVWAEYLFKDGSMIGLNAQLLKDYIEWIANKRMLAISLQSLFKVPAANPLPWTQKWISGSEVQPAPQEVEISSYIIGGTKQDVEEDTFSGLSL